MSDWAQTEQWAPVVYGRTLRVDRWWRAVPRDVDRRWLESLVMAVVAGGRRLVDGPRFLLALGSEDRLVGVACRARLLSDRMHSDGSRELYCFVGWSARRSGGWTPEAPALPDLRAGYRRWAAPVYEDWMERDWERPARDLPGPHDTWPEPAPWIATAPAASGRLPLDEGSMAWPSREADVIWEEARAAYRPMAVSVGWQATSDPLTEDVAGPFHVLADDVDRPFALELRRRAPAPPPPPREDRRRAEPVEPHPYDDPRADDRRRRRRRGGLFGGVKDAFQGIAEALDGPVDEASRDERDRRRAEHERPAEPPPAGTAAPAPRTTYRPPIRPPSHDARRAAKIDAAFTFDDPPASPQPSEPEPAEPSVPTLDQPPEPPVQPEDQPRAVEPELPSRLSAPPSEKPLEPLLPLDPVPAPPHVPSETSAPDATTPRVMPPAEAGEPPDDEDLAVSPDTPPEESDRS
jgi:hypothetical protein